MVVYPPKLRRIAQAYFGSATALVAAFSLSGCSAPSDEALGNFRATVETPRASEAELDASRTLTPQYAASGDESSHYRIGPTDVLAIQVFQADELNRKVQVSSSGTIAVPLIGLVQCLGRTAQQVEAEIASRLRAKYMQSPQVTVFIDEYNSQKITIGGAVKKSGIYPVKGNITLMQAIASAEGMDTVANPSNVLIFREQNGTRYVARFDVEQIKSGIARDPLLQNKDVVQVDNSGVRTALRDFAQPLTGAMTGLGSTATFVSIVK